jgi:hypothetical protein
MTRVSFPFVRFNKETGRSNKSSPGFQWEAAVGLSRIQMPVFGCSSRSNPGNHPFRSILKQEGSKTDLLNRRLQRSQRKSLLVRAWDQRSQERILQKWMEKGVDFRELSTVRRMELVLDTRPGFRNRSKLICCRPIPITRPWLRRCDFESSCDQPLIPLRSLRAPV